MRQMGNVKSNQLFNPDEVRNPPPTNMVDSERDSELEKFIRGRSCSTCFHFVTPAQRLYIQINTSSNVSNPVQPVWPLF